MPPTQLNVPLFPLPGVVLFPGAVLPLRVFEPRYLTLLKDVLAGERFIGMAQLQPSIEHFSEEATQPPIHPVLGVGEVIAQQQLDDGTWHIALLGQGRFKIVEEVPHDPYRIARALVLPDQLPGFAHDRTLLERTRLELHSVAARLMQRTMEEDAQRQFAEILRQRPEAGPVCDLLASIYVHDSAARQLLLERTDVLPRAQMVLAVLKKLLERIGSSSVQRSGAEDVSLN